MNIKFLNNRHKASEQQNEMMGLSFVPTHFIHTMTGCECCRFIHETKCLFHNMELSTDTIGCSSHEFEEQQAKRICRYRI